MTERIVLFLYYPYQDHGVNQIENPDIQILSRLLYWEMGDRPNHKPLSHWTESLLNKLSWGAFVEYSYVFLINLWYIIWFTTRTIWCRCSVGASQLQCIRTHDDQKVPINTICTVYSVEKESIYMESLTFEPWNCVLVLNMWRTSK